MRWRKERRRCEFSARGEPRVEQTHDMAAKRMVEERQNGKNNEATLKLIRHWPDPAAAAARSQPRKQSGAATMLRQSENVLAIAESICSRSNRVLGSVNQHRVHLLMKGLCRAANSCKPGLIVGALRVACNRLCAAARFHTAEENPGCILPYGRRKSWLHLGVP